MGVASNTSDSELSLQAIEAGFGGDQPVEQAKPEELSTIDPEKRRKASWLLRLFVHVRKCRRREQARIGHNCNDEQQPDRCMVPRCKDLKFLVIHLPNCADGDRCQVENCPQMRRLFAHYIDCINIDCFVCTLLKQAKFQQLVPI